MPKPRVSVYQRFADRVEITPTCWIWKGDYRDDYGVLWFGPKELGRAAAHRMSWLLFKGEIPIGLFVCHKCDTPSCVNPDHLFVGTQSDNILDCYAKGRANNWATAKTHCKRGHPLEGKNLTVPRNDRNERGCRACHSLRNREYHARKKATQCHLT